MAWNDDGTFSKIYNWVFQRDNNIPYKAEQQEAQDENFRLGIEQSLNRDGKNAMNANLNLGNFNASNMADATKLNDGATLADVVKFTQGIPCIVSDGSSQAEGKVELTPEIGGLSGLYDGLKIKFKAPFSITAAIIKANKRYEIIDIIFSGGRISKPVIRGAYTEDSGYSDGIKDNRPSFVQNVVYTLVYNETLDGWSIDDGNISGQILDFDVNSYTPAGYIDLGYQYSGQANLGKYKFTASHNPKVNDSNGPQHGFGTSQNAMLPDFTMEVKGGSEDRHPIQNGDGKGVITGRYDPGYVEIEDGKGLRKIQLPVAKNSEIKTGNDLLPFTYFVRKLKKL